MRIGLLMVLLLVGYFVVLPAFFPETAKDLPVISNPQYPISGVTELAVPTTNPQFESLPSSSSWGYLAIGVTDPPRLAGLVSLTIVVEGFRIHSTSNDSWISINLTKTEVDLVKATQIEQLLAVTKVPAGHYNIIRFNVTSARAVTNSSSLDLEIPNKGIQITIKKGGIQIQPSKPVHLIIDVKINEAAIKQARLVPSSWTCYEVQV